MTLGNFKLYGRSADRIKVRLLTSSSCFEFFLIATSINYIGKVLSTQILHSCLRGQAGGQLKKI